MAEKHSCRWRSAAEEQAAQLRAKEVELQARQEEVDRLASKVKELEHQLALATKQIVGPKSERMPTPEDELKKREEPERSRGGYTNPDKRRANAEAKAAAPVRTIPHPVPDEERKCPHCGEDATPIGQGEPSVEWEWIPGHFERRLHVVEVARCRCKLHYVRGPAPVRVQEGCLYGPGLIAKIVVDKCADAIPVYRIEKAMGREGIPMARSTLNDLLHLAGVICKPLWEVALAEVRIDPHLQAEETSLRTQVRPERSFVWTFLSATHTVYVYSASRSGDTPNEVLGGTTGTLTVDGYTGYNHVTDVDGRERTGCWSHARRKLFEAMASAPEAREGLDIILDLFMVERTAKNHGIVGTPAHLELRQRRSQEVLARLEDWRKRVTPLYEPKSAMGQALGYMANQWDRLTAFLSDAKVPIHNNASEASLRIIALARKNSLFFGNDDAGKRFAVLYSLIATCEKHGVNPVAYFTDVLIRIQDHPKSRVPELLPDRWKVTFGKSAAEAASSPSESVAASSPSTGAP
jgi:transposase